MDTDDVLVLLVGAAIFVAMLFLMTNFRWCS